MIEAILSEEDIVTIPRNQKNFVKILNLIPLRAQQFVRDHLVKEREFFDKTSSINLNEDLKARKTV